MVDVNQCHHVKVQYKCPKISEKNSNVVLTHFCLNFGSTFSVVVNSHDMKASISWHSPLVVERHLLSLSKHFQLSSSRIDVLLSPCYHITVIDRLLTLVFSHSRYVHSYSQWRKCWCVSGVKIDCPSPVWCPMMLVSNDYWTNWSNINMRTTKHKISSRLEILKILRIIVFPQPHLFEKK